MTYQQFERKYRRGTAFDRYFTYLQDIAFAGFSAFIVTASVTNRFIKFADSRVFPAIMFSITLLLSLYSLFDIRKKFKIIMWENEWTKQQNIQSLKFVLDSLGFPENKLKEDYTHFMYSNGNFNSTYLVNLFADDQFIVVNVRNFSGYVIDFGGRKSAEESIELLLLQSSLQFLKDNHPVEI